MIVLFNLNSYLGGGEVLLIRLALKMKMEDIEYVIVSVKDSYIEKECLVNQLNYVQWPLRNDNVVYMNKNERRAISQFFMEKFNKTTNLKVYTFCFRDIYNSHICFRLLDNNTVSYATGLYHPDDIKYLSSYTYNKERVIQKNVKILDQYHKNNSTVFMNEGNLQKSVSNPNRKYPIIIPIPIENIDEEHVINSSRFNPDAYKMVWLGRFVDFKISGILMMINYVSQHKHIQFDLIGYGKDKRIIEKYIKLYKASNVNVLDPLHPNELENVLKQYDVGFCMGTSILEVSKYGIPTIICPMFPKNLFRKSKELLCNGLFSSNTGYNLGEIDYNGAPPLQTIDDVINNIENNYSIIVGQTITHVQEFSVDSVFTKYMNFFGRKLYSIYQISLPKVSWGRYFVKRIHYRR